MGFAHRQDVTRVELRVETRRRLDVARTEVHDLVHRVHDHPRHDQQPIDEMQRGQDHEQPRHDQQPIEEMRQRIEHLKEKIDRLRQEGRHEEAEGLEREVEEIIRRNIEEMQREQGHDQPRQGPSNNSEHRSRILNEAVDNMFKAVQELHEADMHELAEQLAREAEKLREKIHK